MIRFLRLKVSCIQIKILNKKVNKNYDDQCLLDSFSMVIFAKKLNLVTLKTCNARYLLPLLSSSTK